MVHLIIIELSLNSIANITCHVNMSDMSSIYCTSKANSFFSLQAHLPEGSGVVRWTFTGVIVRRGTSLCSDPAVHEHLLLLPCGSRLRPYGDLRCREREERVGFAGTVY